MLRGAPLLLLLAAAACAALPTGRLVTVMHAPGDVTACSLIEVSLATGENRTLAPVPACAQLATNFPSFSAFTGASLLLAVNSAPAVFAVDIATGASTPLGALPPSNDTFPLLGLVWVEGAGALTATPLGLFNSTTPGAPAELLVAFEGSESFTGGAFVLAAPPLVYVCDEGSSAIVAVDLRDLSKTALTGLASPIGSVVLAPGRLLQEKGYVLYSTALATGKSTKVVNIPNGPGYPRNNGVAGQGWWWWFDFAALHVADLKAKTTAIVGPFFGISRALGFPVYLA
jgi:hypothetical protein